MTRFLSVVSSFMVLALFVASSCQEESKTSSSSSEDTTIFTPTKENLIKQREQIMLLASESRCSSNNSCRIMAIGSKACGGPSSYIVYGNAEIDLQTLKQLVETYTASEKEYNRINEIISDCSLENPPQNLRCENGRCLSDN